MRFILLLIAAVVAIIAAMAAWQMSSKNVNSVASINPAAQQQSASVNTVDVLVAKNAIPVGTVIDASMVDKQPWPENLVLDGFVTANGHDADVIGKLARSPLVAREPFLNSKLANPNDPSFLAAALPAGMRAVTIATDAVAGIAGYVFPGDHVDILFTHNLPGQLRAQMPDVVSASHGNDSKPTVTEVLAPNIRVLAVNVRSPAGKDASVAIAPSSMTIEVSDAQAQALRLAEKNGTLSLTLRSLKDLAETAQADPTVIGTLTHVHVMDTQTDTVRIVRGAGKDSDAPKSGALAGLLTAPAKQQDNNAVAAPMPESGGSPAETPTDQ